MIKLYIQSIENVISFNYIIYFNDMKYQILAALIGGIATVCRDGMQFQYYYDSACTDLESTTAMSSDDVAGV